MQENRRGAYSLTPGKIGLNGMGKMIGSMEGGITLQTEKKAERGEELEMYIYLIIDAHLNIQNVFASAMH